jgi:hypothetical protein
MSRKIMSSTLAALQVIVALIFVGGAQPAQAESLNTYYKVLIAVRKCELSVEETQLSRLQEIIENRVTDTDASSETIDAIFDEIAADIGTDTPAFCAAYGDTAISILATL